MTTTHTRARYAALFLAFATALSLVSAQQIAPPPIPEAVRAAKLEEMVPVDPLITVGTLPNGFKYYVRENRLPQARAELRLAVNAGSVLEDDDQRGLAHFVEHMAFNGTRNFPGNAIPTFMQSLGMRFGAHVNAHTGFDETVYELQIPTDNSGVIDRALTIFDDFAHNVTFDPREIDKERGVILEEWRLGLGAEERIQNVQFPLLLKGSRYADRLPIGKPEIIRSVTYDRLKQFYSDWYRPDLMGIVMVGDFNKADIEARIKARFSQIQMPAKPRPKPAYEIPENTGTSYSVLTDPEMNGTRLSITSTMKAREQSTIGAYRRYMVERLFGAMLSQRLDEMAQAPNAPFLRAQTGRSLFVRTGEVTSLDALVASGGVERGVSSLFTEVARVARFGFTAGELNRMKLNLERGLERSVVEKDKSPSGPLADEFVRNFTDAEPIPGIVYEYGLNQRFTPEITLAEVNAVAKNWLLDRNRLVAISAPERDKPTLPDEVKLSGAISAANAEKLTAYVDTLANRPLMPTKPMAGKVANASVMDTAGITEWTLSNGLRVVLKPTNFRQDEILFRAVSPGGVSLARDEDYVAAETADAVIANGGLGSFSRIDLEKVMAGTTASVRADISATEEGLAGGAASKDLETMFQLIYLTFTAPRADPVAFKVLTDQLKVTLANRQAQPDVLFNQTLEAALSQNHPRAQPLTPESVNRMNLDRSLAFYKERFADAGDFVFVFVGSFELETMRPLVERYLASLPSLKKMEMVRDVGIRPPSSVVEKQVKSGIAPRSQVSIVFTGPFQNNEQNRVMASAMAETLAGNLQRTLREDLGGTYGVSVVPRFAKRPVSDYRITITFACDPARTDALVKTTFQVIEDFKRNGPGLGQVADTRATLVRELETNLANNSYLLNRILFKYEYGEDVRDIFNMRPFYDQVSVPSLRDAARQYLDTNRYVEVVLVPGSN
ncbi:MAG TPA: insulinase family protein [Vicinamibacterales bacterium]|nr:insulinase family protein [Vicinamibacterales bacterium]